MTNRVSRNSRRSSTTSKEIKDFGPSAALKLSRNA